MSGYCALRKLFKSGAMSSTLIMPILRSDGVVLLDKVDYVDKMMHILQDNRRFSVDKFQSDNTTKTLAKIRQVVKSMVEKKFIMAEVAEFLIPKGAIIPRLYGLPKIHKEGCPMRPILSMVGSPQHRLAKFLANTLKPIEEFYCRHNILDSFDLVDKLRNIELNYNEQFCLGSLDVISLFTSVPLDRCIDVIVNAIQLPNLDIKFDRLSIVQMLEVCAKDTQFMFNGTIYRQNDGVAMGSPLGPILANIYVGYIENKTPQIDTETIFYGRYVDDTIVIARDVQAINQLKDRLNEVDADIQFTIESESNGSIPFLDVRIHSNTNGLKLSWYHKDTWKGSLLHYASFVPMSWKTGLLKGFKTRIVRICSPEYLQQAIDELANVFKSNGYPDSIIQSCFLDYTPTTAVRKSTTVPRKPVFLYLPFMGDTKSYQMTARINRCVQAAYPTARVIIRWNVNKACHFPSKDRLPDLSIPNVVYVFQCPCHEDNYVGRTQLPLRERVRQHLPRWLLEGRGRPRSEKAPNSAITRHVLTCTQGKSECDKLISSFKIAHIAKNTLLLKILEALEIKTRNPTLCVQKENLYELKIPWL